MDSVLDWKIFKCQGLEEELTVVEVLNNHCAWRPKAHVPVKCDIENGLAGFDGRQCRYPIFKVCSFTYLSFVSIVCMCREKKWISWVVKKQLYYH